ncbi:MAG: histidine kinase [Bacteroidia bacterium]|nr:histidine kinase [Bacteroidia bacterium]
MTTRKEQWAKFINKHYKYFLIPIIFFAHKLLFFLTDPYAEPLRNLALAEIFIQNLGLLFFSTILVHGSIRITNRLNKRLPWAAAPALRVVVQIFAQLLLSTVWIFIYQFIIVKLLFDVNMITLITSDNLTPEIRFVIWRFFFASALISLLASLIISGRNFRIESAEIKIQTAHLKQVAAQAELQALKLQLDPHFVFNNFSTLSALIEEDKALAQTFVESLSRVYRYMVQNIHSDTITLQKEVKFIESYNYLISIRHGDNVRIAINIADEFLQKRIPPITLQLLIENAIKHNMATKAKPLTINIYVADNKLIVSNNLQLIAIPHQASSHIGLENIKSRYRIVSGVEPVIIVTADNFGVKLPLLD